MNPDATWHPVESHASSNLRDRAVVETACGGRTICLTRIGDAVHAFQPYCPHAGVPLCTGWVDSAGQVVCPAHGYKFSVRNGLCRGDTGYRLKTFAVRVEDDRIFVALPT